MKRVCIIGNFGKTGIPLSDGQTVKTNTLYEAMQGRYGSREVGQINTRGGFVALAKLLLASWLVMWRYRNIVIMPAQRALPIVAPLLAFENLFFRRKLHYVVIGGWLMDFVRQHPWMRHVLNRLSHIYVETNILCERLRAAGFDNVKVVPNGKKLSSISQDDAVSFQNDNPLRLVYLGRVNEMKGLLTAVRVINRINDRYESPRLSLAIYGPIENTEWFENFKVEFSDQIIYKGVSECNKTVTVLKDYYAMLFPTKYYTEGIPGSIIDAYMAGVPVIASRWESFSDVVEEGVTGLGYTFDDERDLERLLSEIVECPERLLAMRGPCVCAASRYGVEQMIEKIELC